jgi:Zn-finger nucleic acid-binding protein
MASEKCPRDGAVLEEKAVFGDDSTALVCPRCIGVLIPWTQAQTLFTRRGLSLADVQALVRAAEKSDRATLGPCPHCESGRLKPLKVNGVELDLCESCGQVWFDRKELTVFSPGKYGQQLASDAQVLEGERSEVDGVYEMLWDCGFCQASKLLGVTNRHCPNCGAPQDPTKRYFPKEGEAVAVNVEFDGADVVCPACATPNGVKSKHCRQCGSPLEGAAAVATQVDQTSRPVGAAVAPKKRGPLWALIGLLSAGTCGVCGVFSLWTKDVSVTVVGHRWERSIDVESMRVVQDSDWCDGMPAGAFSVSRRREQRDTRRVADGEVCHTRNVDRGNGSFEQRRECEPKYREEPVYDQRCYYSIERWVTTRSPAVRGDSLSDSPRWPDVSLRTGTCVGCERAGRRHENYSLQLQGADGTRWECDVSESKWRSLPQGTQRQVKVGVLTGQARCASL